MVLARANDNCVLKHFAIDDEHAYVQYSLTMSQEEFEKMTSASAQACQNKILIQALDISQSMKGEPVKALKEGANLIGEKYFNAESPPGKFTTILYNNEVGAFDATNLAEYWGMIGRIETSGGTNFMNVFKYINQLLDENPETEELVCIFITDGQDGYKSKEKGKNAT